TPPSDIAGNIVATDEATAPRPHIHHAALGTQKLSKAWATTRDILKVNLARGAVRHLETAIEAVDAKHDHLAATHLKLSAVKAR
ncbi:UNVERIFIED_CONTAM: hypothetical protein NY603_24090, partial [Bacteroidetes bacterium 56_B9]